MVLPLRLGRGDAVLLEYAAIGIGALLLVIMSVDFIWGAHAKTIFPSGMTVANDKWKDWRPAIMLQDPDDLQRALSVLHSNGITGCYIDINMTKRKVR